MESTALLSVALAVIVVQASLLAFLVFLGLFEPSLPYEITGPIPSDLTSDAFLRLMTVLGKAHVDNDTSIEILRNGEVFYPAEIEAIRSAKRTVHLEAYILYKSAVARRFLDALTACARRGVRVRMVIDAVGSFTTWDRYFRELRDAGGEVCWYHPLRWHTWPRFNNRTHRELIIIDGEVAFIGGAGIADQWLTGSKRRRRWRDTMFRVEGAAVSTLQSTFSENWLEASGQLLTELAPDPPRGSGTIPAVVTDSSPTTGRSTRARMIVQALLAASRDRIVIATPYFLPDRSLRRELTRAIRERHVAVTILTPGQHSDQLLTRRSSRRLYGELLRAGARIYEYEPSMMHAKTMVVDGTWSLIGSANLDPRSFALNDEITVAARDHGLAARLEADFAADLTSSRAVTYQTWRRRPSVERFHEWIGWVLERQQ